MLQALDGPSKQDILVVTTAAVSEVKLDTEPLPARKVITLQPMTSLIRVYFADEGETPTLTDVQTKGFEQPKKTIRSYEASDSQAVFIVAMGANTDVIVAERA